MNDRIIADGTTATAPVERIRRGRRAFLVVALVLPAVLTAVALGFVLAWLPAIPDPAATHWGVGGVDRTGPAATYLWLTPAIGLGIPALLAAATLTVTREQWGGAARLLGALALGLSAFSGLANVGSVAIQRGVRTAGDVGGIGGVLLLGAAALLAFAAAGWFLQPHVPSVPGAPLAPAHIAAISAGERVSWLATARMPRGVLILLSGVVVLVVAITAMMAYAAAEHVWIPLLTLAIIGFALASSTTFRVRADARGLSVRSPLGWPRITVPIEEITAVRAVDLDPFGEFGGFGFRLGTEGRVGVVLRRGPALEVTRRDRGPVVVTVDGAEVGAGVLQAYLDARGNASRRPGAQPQAGDAPTATGAGPDGEEGR